MEADFSLLTPDRVLDAVEEGAGQRCTGLIRPLPSYINRVYTVELESGEHVVAKFYRPGRWTREAVLAEHAFVRACAAEEIPVIAPLALSGGETLGEVAGIAFALFPRRGGRPIEPADPGDAMWGRLGALLARIHRVGACAAAWRMCSLASAAMGCSVKTRTDLRVYKLSSMGFMRRPPVYGCMRALARAAVRLLCPLRDSIGLGYASVKPCGGGIRAAVAPRKKDFPTPAWKQTPMHKQDQRRLSYARSHFDTGS